MFQTEQANSLSCIFNLLSWKKILVKNFWNQTSCLPHPVCVNEMPLLLSVGENVCWQTHMYVFVVASLRRVSQSSLDRAPRSSSCCWRVWDVSPSEHHLLWTDTSEKLQNVFCIECMSVAIATCHRKNCLPGCYQFSFQFSHALDKLSVFWKKDLSALNCLITKFFFLKKGCLFYRDFFTYLES